MASILWPTHGAGTMDSADLRARVFCGARADMYGTAVRVYWTLNGEASGDPIFYEYMPMVLVMASSPTNAQAWTNTAQWGTMLRDDFVSNAAPYARVTAWDATNETYYTDVSQGNPANSATGAANGQRSGSSIQVARRPIFLLALGIAAGA
jgi:hypothetical protein